MTRKRPTKPRNQVARKPSWIADVQNQNRWTQEFAKRLREIKQSDATISAICGNHQVLRHCAAQVRLYTDLTVTTYLRQERNRRGKKQVARLKAAIKGIGEAMEFYVEFGNQAAASQLDCYKRDLSEKLQRGKQAYSSKRHGRDRDHTILVRLQVFLERHVGQVTNATLATLVNKAMEVDNRAESERFTEETVEESQSLQRKEFGDDDASGERSGQCSESKRREIDVFVACLFGVAAPKLRLSAISRKGATQMPLEQYVSLSERLTWELTVFIVSLVSFIRNHKR